MPRHPPKALSSLTFYSYSTFTFFQNQTSVSEDDDTNASPSTKAESHDVTFVFVQYFVFKEQGSHPEN